MLRAEQLYTHRGDKQMFHGNQCSRVLVIFVVVGSAPYLIANANPATKPAETHAGLSLAEADEAMTILKLYCGETGLTVSYLGPCGASGNLASGRVWGPMSSTGSWTISEEEDNGSRNWVEIQIHHPPADSDDTVLFLLKGELSISTEAVVDDTNLVDPNRFRFKNGRTWPEMLATLSDYSKKESELRRELSRINWNEIHRLVESKEE